jgi:parallel beta-helix repeat protein
VIQVGDGTNSYSNVTISDLQVDGNRSNQGGTSYGIYFNSNISYSKIDGTYLYDTYSSGIYDYSSSGYNIFSNNIMVPNGGYGIMIVSSNNEKIVNNLVRDGGSRGIQLTGSKKNVISGNHVFSFNDHGIYFADSSNNNIVDSNVIESNSYNGIVLSESKYNTIQSNIFRNNGAGSDNAYSEIAIVDDDGIYSTYNVISNNSIEITGTNKAKYAISEETSNEDYNVITNNIITGTPGTANFSILGPHTTVAGNKTSSSTEGIFDIQSQSGATQSTLTVTQNGTGNIVDFKYSSTSLFTIVNEDRLKVEGNLITTVGAFNDNIIDDMEDVADWTASDGTNTPVTSETTKIKVNDAAMKITTVAGSSNTDTVQKTISSEDWSSADRIGFWIQGTQTGQIISLQFYDTDAITSDYNITISNANEWQYEEWDISGITSTSRDVISWIQFVIDDDTNSRSAKKI